MEDLTILFFLLAIGVYILQLFLKRTDKGMELALVTLVLGVSSLACCVTDPSLREEITGTIPMIISFLIIGHSIANMIWRT